MGNGYLNLKEKCWNKSQNMHKIKTFEMNEIDSNNKERMKLDFDYQEKLGSWTNVFNIGLGVARDISVRDSISE